MDKSSQPPPAKKCEKYSPTDKLMISFVLGLIVFFLMTPYTFTLTNALTSSFGLNIANNGGCPNLAGCIVHALVFMLIVRLLLL